MSKPDRFFNLVLAAALVLSAAIIGLAIYGIHQAHTEAARCKARGGFFWCSESGAICECFRNDGQVLP